MSKGTEAEFSASAFQSVSFTYRRTVDGGRIESSINVWWPPLVAGKERFDADVLPQEP